MGPTIHHEDLFFGFTSPRDLLEKARRELERFKAAPSSDHAFNFFVTVYHIRDWAKAQGVPVAQLDADPDFELCRLACNQGKHFRLTGGTLTRSVERHYESHQDMAYSGAEEYAVLADDTRIDVVCLGNRVLEKIAVLLAEP
jgi:hypothetical protein